MDHLFSSYGLLALLIGYLLGSIPFGLLLTKAAGLGDVRSIGSGNIGATNVLRTGHKGLAAATLLLDTLKGTVAVLLVDDVARRFGGFDAFQLWAISPASARSSATSIRSGCSFIGGKGVATYIGVLIGMHLPAAIVFGIVWIGVAATTRFPRWRPSSATVTVVLYYLVTGWAGLTVVAIMPRSSSSSTTRTFAGCSMARRARLASRS